jgi:hypothetical protein
VGLGQQTPLEVGFSFHHLWGVPVVPGSALKGLSLAAARERDATSADLGRVFGTQNRAGTVDFLDALPEKAQLDIDILNPHYPDYYAENTDYARDDEKTNPVKFPAVPQGTAFRFDLVGRSNCEPVDLDQAQRWLRIGLTELGAGAKTAAGYGLFEDAARAPGPESKATAAPMVEEWAGAVLQHVPNTGGLRAVAGARRAELTDAKVAGGLRAALPADARDRLLKKRELKGVTVKVERQGNSFRILEVKLPES